MASPIDHSAARPWEDEGRRISPELDGCHGALVLALDPVAAAEVAIGIARAQARRRRAAVADVVGELPPVQELIPADAAYGLMDAFFYGVSMSKVAQIIGPARNLIMLPSGVTPIDPESILASDRWAHLAAGFREVDALLLVVAPYDAAGLARVLRVLDGVVLVGDIEAPAGARVLARAGSYAPPIDVVAPRPTTELPMTDVRPADLPGADKPLVDVPLGAAPLADMPPSANRTADAPAPLWPADSSHAERRTNASIKTPKVLYTVANVGGRPLPVWLGIAAAVAVALGGVTWAMRRYLPPKARTASTAAAPADSGALPMVAQTGDTGPRHDSTMASNGSTALDAGAVASSLAVANPGDSAAAAGYAVAIAYQRSVTSASSRIEQERARDLPALTYTPFGASADTANAGYLVLTGAFPTRDDAVALLRDLRTRHVLTPGSGHVVHVPFALLVQKGVAADRVSVFMNGYHLKGLPVYALVQRDGSLNVYAGAFETVDAARAMIATFRAGGDAPRVAYRTGRAP